MTHESPGPNATSMAAADEQALTHRAQALPRHLAPAPDLWDNIAQEIEFAKDATPPDRAAQDPSPWPRRTAWALAAGLVLGFSALLLVNVAAPVPEVDDTVAVAALDTNVIPVQLPQMRDQMLAMLDSEFADLPPAVRDTVLHNLQVITTAREDIERALGVHPNDPLLRRLLMANYGNELNLLQNLESISRQQQQRIQL